MTPGTLSRTLAALEAAGLIRVSPGRIDVPDRETLLRAIPRDPRLTSSRQARYSL
jgi:DNA-binding MarR family transcriptional regulator